MLDLENIPSDWPLSESRGDIEPARAGEREHCLIRPCESPRAPVYVAGG